MKHTEEYWKDMDCYVQSFESGGRVHRATASVAWAECTPEEKDFLEFEAHNWIEYLRTDINFEERGIKHGE